MKFDKYLITESIKKNIELLGYKKPTDIQYKAIPQILKRNDVLAIAQTGTGKTAAFVIPVLHLLLSEKRLIKTNLIRCVVMVPTRELARQILDVFRELGKKTGIVSLAILGGVEQESQIEKLKSGVDVLIATPGRLFDLQHQGYVSLQQLKILVLDEADLMLEKGFIKDIRDLLRFLPEKRQTLFFSATIDDTIKKLAYSLVSNPIRIEISPKDKVSKHVDHSVIFVSMDDKRFYLEQVIKDHAEAKILVFVRTKVRAERVVKAMERVNIHSETIHGDVDQQQRFDVLNRFKTGENKILIATDVSARGIDIPNVDYVINYDVSAPAENYIHRVGRTGRGQQRGSALSFCSDEEKEILQEIEERIGAQIKVIEISKNEQKDILDFSEERNTDWKGLLAEEETRKKKKKKKK